MLALADEIITSDRLTLSSPEVKALPLLPASTMLPLTASSWALSASEKLTLAAGVSVGVPATPLAAPKPPRPPSPALPKPVAADRSACGRLAAALSWAIIAWIWLLSMPPVFIVAPYCCCSGKKSAARVQRQRYNSHLSARRAERVQAVRITAPWASAAPSKARNSRLFSRWGRSLMADNVSQDPSCRAAMATRLITTTYAESHHHGSSGRTRHRRGGGQRPGRRETTLHPDTDGEELPARPGRGGFPGDHPGTVAVEQAARIRRAVFQFLRPRRRRHHGRARQAEHQAQVFRRRHGDPGADRPGARHPPEAGGRGLAQRRQRRLRADGKPEAGRLAIPRTSQLPARPRRRAGPLGRVAGRRRERPRPPGAAETVGVRARAAKAD